ncbi:TPA: hypothetical protein QB661_001416 [Pasteurella multocida]|nr:hypothetical protein [Pasteurella multocida]
MKRLIKWSRARPFGLDLKETSLEYFLVENEKAKEQFYLFEFYEFLKKKGMKELPRHFFWRFPNYTEIEMIGLEEGRKKWGSTMTALETTFNLLSLIKEEKIVIGEMRAIFEKFARKLDMNIRDLKKSKIAVIN